MRFHALLFVVVFSAVAVSGQEPTTRIRAATVIDGSGKVLRNATIVVQGSKITSIDTGVSGSASYNLGQLTVLPGMIDVHAHVAWHFDKDGRYAARPGSPASEILYSAENAFVTLMAGFTTIQSPGSASDVELREAMILLETGGYTNEASRLYFRLWPDVAKLSSKFVAPQPVARSLEPVAITIDEFAKMDLRAGKILACEKVPKKDKLLKLSIDLGEAAPRTIVSGVAQSYQFMRSLGLGD